MDLEQLAAAQGGVFTLAQALERHPRAEVRRRIRAREWLPQRRGVYAHRATVAGAYGDARATHALACAARLLASDDDLVVSHRSAAVLHGIPLLEEYVGEPQLTLPRPPGTPPAHVRGLFAAYLPEEHRETAGGLPTTNRARTVADCARDLCRGAALAMADAALRAKVPREDVQDVLATCRRWPGVRQADEVLAMADRRAESALESLARLWCLDAGLPVPDLQLRICRLEDGGFVGRVDMAWLAYRTVCELDGRLKYVADGERGSPDDVLWREKRREDDLRELGLEVVRGYWSDRPAGGRSLVSRVRAAMARGAARSDVPSYGVLSDRTRW